jgi:hypothetical protein
MPMQEQAELWMALRDRMKESWTELTIQEKKAGKLPPPRPPPCRFPRHHGSSTPSRSLGEAPGLQPGWPAMDWGLPIDGLGAPRSCRSTLRHSCTPARMGRDHITKQTTANRPVSPQPTGSPSAPTALAPFLLPARTRRLPSTPSSASASASSSSLPSARSPGRRRAP